MIDSIVKAGLSGVQRGLESAANHAQEISTAFQPDSESDYVSAAVGLQTDRFQVEASVKVLQVADDLQGTVLDLLA
jgi:hypothetical protein